MLNHNLHYQNRYSMQHFESNQKESNCISFSFLSTFQMYGSSGGEVIRNHVAVLHTRVMLLK